MGKICAIKSCESARKISKKKKNKQPILSFFKATADKSKRLENWSKCLGINLKNTDQICQLHFREVDIKSYDKIIINGKSVILPLVKKKLMEGALPTLEHQYKFDDVSSTSLNVYNSNRGKVIHNNVSYPDHQYSKIIQQPAVVNELDNCEPMNIQLESPAVLLKDWIVPVLPEYWSFTKKLSHVEFMRVDLATKQIKHHIRVNQDLSVIFICSNNQEICLDEKITALDDIYNYLKSVEKRQVCVGTSIDYQKYSDSCRGVIIGDDSYKTMRANPRCKPCRHLRIQLQTRKNSEKNRIKKSVACKNQARIYMKKCKRLKTSMKLLKEKTCLAIAECARKSNLVVEKEIARLPEEYRMVVSSCFEAAKKSNPKSRRYDLKWIYECLLIKLKSRSTYQFIRKRNILPLPSLETLNKFVRKINSSAYGFQTSTFQCLKERAQSMNESQKRGVLLVDEIKLCENVTFDPQSMKYYGFVDLGQHTPDKEKDKPADHALVFMFVPFIGGWTQTLGYFKSKNACTVVSLQKLTVECIILMENGGIKVDAVVSGGSTSNRDVWKFLGINANCVSCEHPYDSQRKLWMLSDFHHLVKCFRNGTINEKLEEFHTPYGIVRRKHWEAVIAAENHLQPDLKIASKLTRAHLNPKGFQKMNVPLATQVFGHEVSVAMAQHQNTCDDLKDSLPSQKLIDLMSHLIEAMSSRTPDNALYVKEDCRQRKAIHSFLKYLEEWGSMKKKLPISPSTLLGLKVTLKATLEILDMLYKNNSYEYLMTATLSQDPLKRFFSVIRFSCDGNDHPDPQMFGQVYRLLSNFSLIRPPKGCNVTGTQLLKSLMEANSIKVCNKDKEQWLLKLDDLLDGHIPLDQSFASEDDQNYGEVVTSNEIQSYITGYIARTLRKIIKCSSCIDKLLMDQNRKKELDRNINGDLLYASDELFILTQQLEDCVVQAITNSKIHINIIEDIYEEMKKIKLQIVGCSHHTKNVTKKVVDIFIIIRSHFLVGDKEYNIRVVESVAQTA